MDGGRNSDGREIPCQAGSDLHEWHHDCPAASKANGAGAGRSPTTDATDAGSGVWGAYRVVGYAGACMFWTKLEKPVDHVSQAEPVVVEPSVQQQACAPH